MPSSPKADGTMLTVGPTLGEIVKGSAQLRRHRG